MVVRTRTFNILGGLIVAATALAATHSAAAMPILTFGFTDNLANFTLDAGGTTGTYSAVASTITDGDVTRPDVPATADFQADFISGADPANFTVSMAITGIGAATATGTGSFSIVDVDGDTITGNIAGSWDMLAGIFASFEGSLSNVVLTPSNDTFNGTTGSFGMDLAGDAPYPGAVVILMQPGNWFTGSFTGANTLVQGAIVPEPTTLGLILLGGLAALRRRAA